MLRDAPVTLPEKVFKIVFRVEPNFRDVRVQSDLERFVADATGKLNEGLSAVGRRLESLRSLLGHAESGEHFRDSLSLDSSLADLDHNGLCCSHGVPTRGPSPERAGPS